MWRSAVSVADCLDGSDHRVLFRKLIQLVVNDQLSGSLVLPRAWRLNFATKPPNMSPLKNANDSSIGSAPANTRKRSKSKPDPSRNEASNSDPAAAAGHAGSPSFPTHVAWHHRILISVQAIDVAVATSVLVLGPVLCNHALADADVCIDVSASSHLTYSSGAAVGRLTQSTASNKNICVNNNNTVAGGVKISSNINSGGRMRLLSKDLLLYVLSWVGPSSFVRFSVVSRYWYAFLLLLSFVVTIGRLRDALRPYWLRWC